MMNGKIKILGNFSASEHRSSDVHDINGISPTLRAQCHGHPPLILVYEERKGKERKGKITILPYDDYNSRIPPKKEWDFIGTITPNCGTLAIRNGWKIIEIYEYEEENSTSKYD